MRTRKSIIAFLFVICLLTVCGCSSKEVGPQKLWERYVEAVNSKNNEGIAATYFAEGSSAYTQYLSDEENFRTVNEIDSIKTTSFEYLTQSDLSSSTVVQKYFSAKINATIEVLGESYDSEFEVYMSETNVNGWFFTTPVNINPFEGELGNIPDDLWLRSALHTEGDFLYKPFYTLDGNVVTYSGIAISNYVGNGKDVVIPAEINGLPVTTIKKYAFMKLGSIFEITFSNSKMRTLSIPETVTTIEDYAFFEAGKLKELTIPSGVKTIGEFAFASCVDLKKISFDINDSELYSEEFLKEIASKSDSGIEIKGARNMYVGDIINLKEGNNKLVNWSVDKSNVASIDTDKGTLTAKSSGTVVITASLKSDPTIKATVTLTVSNCSELIKIQGSAFDRCSNLEEMYIYATNPNSFGVAGTSFKLNPAITIYVPKGSKEMYQNSTTWATYKDQIKEME